MSLKRKVATITLATASVLGVGIAAAAPAYASSVILEGEACPGGYITDFIWSGPNSSGFGTYGGNGWTFQDNTYNGSSAHYEIAVQCNNGVFYYPSFNISGRAGTYNIGWI